MAFSSGVHQWVKLEVLHQLGSSSCRLLCTLSHSLLLGFKGEAGGSCSKSRVLILLEKIESWWCSSNVFGSINVQVSVCGGKVTLTTYNGVHISEGEEHTGNKLLITITDNPSFDLGAGLLLKNGCEI